MSELHCDTSAPKLGLDLALEPLLMPLMADDQPRFAGLGFDCLDNAAAAQTIIVLKARRTTADTPDMERQVIVGLPPLLQPRQVAAILLP